MRWHHLPNIWSKRTLPKDQISDLVRVFRPLGLDYRKAAEQYRIKIYQRNSGPENGTECTVATAIQDYIFPGRWMVPRRLARRSTVVVDGDADSDNVGRLGQDLMAVPEYDIVDIRRSSRSKRAMASTRGPQIFPLGLNMTSSLALTMLSQAYEALKTGKTTTFAITTYHGEDDNNESFVDGEFAQHSDGSSQVNWLTVHNFPHFWPPVIQACMPQGCKLAMEPQTDDRQIQFVIQPLIADAVKEALYEVELREADKLL